MYNPIISKYYINRNDLLTINKVKYIYLMSNSLVHILPSIGSLKLDVRFTKSVKNNAEILSRKIVDDIRQKPRNTKRILKNMIRIKRRMPWIKETIWSNILLENKGKLPFKARRKLKNHMTYLAKKNKQISKKAKMNNWWVCSIY